MNYRIVYSNELYHHGVKGMRWGVRKQRSIAGGLRRGFAAKQNMSPEQRAVLRKQRAKKAAAVGGVAVVAALSIYGARKYKSLKGEMHEMNNRINFGKQMVEGLYKDNKSFNDSHNPALSSSISYLGNDFKFHTATKTANSYENLNVDTQKAFNSVRDYARAKKRYTGRY